MNVPNGAPHVPTGNKPCCVSLGCASGAFSAVENQPTSLLNSASGVFAPCSAAITRGVTFSVDCNTLTSRSGDFISASGVAA